MQIANSDDSPRVTKSGGILPPMVSYAQNYEDVLLRRALQDVENGFYIDVGAFDPVSLSVTNWFYGVGWCGVNIEPNPEFARRLSEARPRDINLAMAISDSIGRSEFYLIEGTGLSSLQAAEPESFLSIEASRRKIEVETTTLNHIFDNNVRGKTVDFLKIDAEGAEVSIIAGIDLAKHRPRIILIESTEPFTQISSWNRWENLLTESNYNFVYFDGLNRYYVREEDAERAAAFAVPPCFFDNFTLSSSVMLKERICELERTFEHMDDSLKHHQKQLEHSKILVSQYLCVIENRDFIIGYQKNYIDKLQNHLNDMSELIVKSQQSFQDLLVENKSVRNRIIER